MTVIDFRWKNNYRVRSVPMSEVVLKEKEHLEAKEYPIEKDSGLPLIVHRTGKNEYRLISGWNKYMFNKQNGINTVEIINTSAPTKAFFMSYIGEDRQYISTNLVKIGWRFINTKPSAEKIERAIESFEENGVWDKPITLDRFGYLVDGYTRYIAALMMGVAKISYIVDMESNVNAKEVKYQESNKIKM